MYLKINKSHITFVIITFHEIKPLAINHADMDKCQKLVHKILEVRDEYIECMQIGKALLEMACDQHRRAPMGDCQWVSVPMGVSACAIQMSVLHPAAASSRM
jgi:hypothetical protein